MEDTRFVWMVSVNDFDREVRYATKEVLEEVLKNGLMSYPLNSILVLLLESLTGGEKLLNSILKLSKISSLWTVGFSSVK